MKNAFIAYLYAFFAAFSLRLLQLEIFVLIVATTVAVRIGGSAGYLPAVKGERSLRNVHSQQ